MQNLTEPRKAKTNFTSLFLFFAFLVIGYTAIYVKRGSVTLNEVYVDSHGDEWRVPTNGTVTKITEFLINEIPRLNGKLKVIGNNFDLDNSDYNTSSILFICLLGLVGVVFLIIVLIFLLARYACGCCGGKKLPRHGYTQTAINSVRISLLVFSFLFEGILIYGYFVNADLHKSFSKLIDYFEETGVQIDEDMKTVTEDIKKINGTSYNYIFDKNRDAIITDLEFSTRYAVSQTVVMKKFFNKFESLRMSLILLNLILSIVGCAVGVAAGSVMRGWVMIIMVAINTVATVFFFFSTGCHFAGAKILYEYCDEIDYYLADSHYSEQIPMRLQFFIPCLNSPVLDYANDYFAQNTAIKLALLQNKINDGICKDFDPNQEEAEDNKDLRIFCESPPYWFNVTDEYYNDSIYQLVDEGQREEYIELLENATQWANSLVALDRQRRCEYSRNKMKQENFLMCLYTKDNMDMIMISQAVGCILVVIITLIGLPAIKKFEWAGYANMGGLHANKQNQFIGRSAKPKRKPNKK